MTAMTIEPTDHDRALASYLAHRQADWLDAVRPVDLKVADARFRGGCDAAHALGYGATPADIALRVIEWVRAQPRPAGGAFPTARKAWTVEAETVLGSSLAEARR